MSNALMPVHGSCHCGAVTYEATVDPEQVTVCHCTDCQRLTGSAYRVSVATPVDAFRLIRGAPKIYVKTADSGHRRAQAFCPECGSPLYTYALDDPSTYGLRVGGLRERGSLAPRQRIWCSSALPWSIDLRGLPGRDRE